MCHVSYGIWILDLQIWSPMCYYPSCHGDTPMQQWLDWALSMSKTTFVFTQKIKGLTCLSIFKHKSRMEFGHLGFVMSVFWLSVWKIFNLGHNFLTVGDRDFIFGMHTQLIKPFQKWHQGQWPCDFDLYTNHRTNVMPAKAKRDECVATITK